MTYNVIIMFDIILLIRMKSTIKGLPVQISVW